MTKQLMKRPLVVLGLLSALSACGGNDSSLGPTINSSTDRGTLIASPPNRVPIPQDDGTTLPQLDPTRFKTLLDRRAPGLTQITGTPICTISNFYFQYMTVGAKGEPASASGAIYVPSGADPACSGPRPVVLYAHGTTVEKSFNMANVRGNSEASLVAATYAAQGFIVVASNYAGYDTSSLPYHPFLNADQQAKDVIDSLRAARKAFPAIGASDSGKLFLTGYSQGGFVAMAALREMQTNHASEFKVTALAGLSGAYAISLINDTAFGGAPNLGGTYFLPFASSSWQKAYGDVYAAPSDLYEAQYASGIENLMPGDATLATLFSSGKLPQTATFAADSLPGPVSPSFAGFFGSGNLVKSSFRTSYLADAQANPCGTNAATPLSCTPANGLRKAAVANDLRNFTPTSPVLMCGGSADPSVFFTSTTKTAEFFATKGLPVGAVTVLDLEAAISGPGDPFAAAKAGFAQSKANTVTNATNSGQSPATAVATAYHPTLVPPFCNAAARGFFQKILAQ
jgi:hypothetical protein